MRFHTHEISFTIVYLESAVNDELDGETEKVFEDRREGDDDLRPSEPCGIISVLLSQQRISEGMPFTALYASIETMRNRNIC